MQKKYYHLASTKVIFQDPEDNRVAEMDYNVVLETDSKNLGIKDIGTTQKNAQILFYKSMEKTDFKVIDVFIYGFSYMGHQTPEAFAYRPDEKPTEDQLNALEKTFGKKVDKNTFDV